MDEKPRQQKVKSQTKMCGKSAPQIGHVDVRPSVREAIPHFVDEDEEVGVHRSLGTAQKTKNKKQTTMTKKNQKLPSQNTK